jgi:hypothetical protein
MVAQAVLTNYEEVDLMPIYRDPVHDFGFMQVSIQEGHDFSFTYLSLSL